MSSDRSSDLSSSRSGQTWKGNNGRPWWQFRHRLCCNGSKWIILIKCALMLIWKHKLSWYKGYIEQIYPEQICHGANFSLSWMIDKIYKLTIWWLRMVLLLAYNIILEREISRDFRRRKEDLRERDSEFRLRRIVLSGDLRLHRQFNPCWHGIITDFKLMMIMILEVLASSSNVNKPY